MKYVQPFESVTGMAGQTLALFIFTFVIAAFYVWAAWTIKGYWNLYANNQASQADLFSSAGRAILLVLIVSFLLGKAQ